MIRLMRGVFDGGENIVALKVGIILQDFLIRRSGAQQFQNVGHAHPHAANARPAAAFSRLDGDARKQLFVQHDNKITPAVFRRKRAFWHGRAAPCVAITYEAGAGEKTSETVIQKIFDELPVP